MRRDDKDNHSGEVSASAPSASEPVESIEQALVQHGERFLSRLLLQEVAHRIVEAEGAAVEVERKQQR